MGHVETVPLSPAISHFHFRSHLRQIQNSKFKKSKTQQLARFLLVGRLLLLLSLFGDRIDSKIILLMLIHKTLDVSIAI